uniref:Putative secreted protein n=1 Tax=Xenopsylla cheopis TaxID=163159 RepID=A0A6M2DUP7_XENCH
MAVQPKRSCLAVVSVLWSSEPYDRLRLGFLKDTNFSFDTKTTYYLMRLSSISLVIFSGLLLSFLVNSSSDL